MNNLILFLNSLNSAEQYGWIFNDGKRVFQKLIENKNINFDKNEFRKELVESLNNLSFDWCKLLLESDYKNRINFNRNIDFGRTLSFTYDDIIMLIDILDYSSMTNGTSDFSIKNKLRECLQDEYLPNYSGISEFLDRKLFWLDFKVKHQFLSKIGYDIICNNDVIYLIKSNCWDDLYANFYNQRFLDDLSLKANLILQNYQENDGWLDMNNLLILIRDDKFEIDLFTLSKLKWDTSVLSIKHYKNDLSLGFKKYG